MFFFPDVLPWGLALRAVGLLPLCLLVACAACNQLPPPSYRPPSASAAYAAFTQAFKADRLDRPLEPEGFPDAGNFRQYVANDQRKVANERANRAYRDLQGLDVGQCAWERYSL